MINWNEVTVGETEITDQYTQIRRLAKGRDGGYVWAMDVNGVHAGCYYSWAEDGYRNWTIYDPLEEIADQVTLEPIRVSICGHGDAEYVVFVGCYKGKRLLWTDPNISFDGRRVWTRKEG